jgi:hypothetical protein
LGALLIPQHYEEMRRADQPMLAGAGHAGDAHWTDHAALR